jgi:hypothetical protein
LRFSMITSFTKENWTNFQELIPSSTFERNEPLLFMHSGTVPSFLMKRNSVENVARKPISVLSIPIL